ncbi:Por secretion system C-terminal sorting domain-containing protein [Catalinimonas alkaloidigena]|uniref:Por secretion system C-terminal sorting domain-containing protein n=1 Tax=Catalinimonas alkaloidigena TaxID=1075417 RepID=A0A1G9FEF2_9BACT|nr:T9SS type A sorting domain-containing protein [Catalinimonas alkaloidigena]SDK86593.1 Por secretion system C-terminal sorting domain-containing protein [Catalinimonas alkaloidigena]
MKSRKRLHLRPRTAVSTRLHTVAKAFALTALFGIGVFLYIQFGNSDRALAAPPTSISGVINSYARVVAKNYASRLLAIDNFSGSWDDFQIGDKVMIMQMKGASVSTANDATFGSITGYGMSGRYELTTIEDKYITNVNGTNYNVLAFSSLLYDYSATTQVVRVPQYENATVTGTLTALPWDPTLGRGGILALEVEQVLRLEGDIDVSELGFIGGIPNTTSNGGGTDDATYFTAEGTGFGQKGEGIVNVTNDNYRWGRGAVANGGGGGNTHNAGGGGGSNYTRGGNGGDSYYGPGGNGVAGYALDYNASENRVFLGGGGGGGQQNNGNSTSGGRGGGLALVRAGSLVSDCAGTHGIRANGQSAANTVGGGNDGGGGGGAGGTLMLDVNSMPLNCELTFEANGGNGGSVTSSDSHGGGGGGGAGAILRFTSASSPYATFNQTPGSAGAGCNTCDASQPGVANTGNNGDPCPVGGCAQAETAWVVDGEATVLPVTLISFEATPTAEHAVQLHWATAAEVNNAHFTLERSADGNVYTPLVQVEGAGTVNQRRDYTWTDQQPLAGTSYYRLSQTDFDGTTETFAPVAVTLSEKAQVSLSSAYPNPFRDVLHIVYESNEAGTGRILLTNQQGVAVKSQQEALIRGKQEVSLSGVAHLPSGLYFVTIEVNDQVSNVIKVVKQ